MCWVGLLGQQSLSVLTNLLANLDSGIICSFRVESGISDCGHELSSFVSHKGSVCLILYKYKDGLVWIYNGLERDMVKVVRFARQNVTYHLFGVTRL